MSTQIKNTNNINFTPHNGEIFVIHIKKYKVIKTHFKYIQISLKYNIIFI